MDLSGINDVRRQRALAYILSKWQPHPGQQELIQAVLAGKSDIVYGQCGRKWGKSECCVFLCWAVAILKDNAEVYYMAPSVKLAKELVWHNNRMKTCNTYDSNFLIDMGRILGGKIEIYKQDSRVILPNNSFIKVDGSDNIDNQLGLKPDFIVADEYRTFKEDWMEFMRPNLAPKSGKMVFISTPPLSPNHAYELVEECRRGMIAENPAYFYINLPSQANNTGEELTRWFEVEKARLISLGREKEWTREFMAQYITSNENAIIPQLNRDSKNIVEDVKLVEEIAKNGIYEAYVCINPGNSTMLGALLLLINRNSGNLYILDEFMEKDSQRSSITTTWPIIKEKFQKTLDIHPNLHLKLAKDAIFICPPKAPWFRRDMDEIYDMSVEEASKDCDKPEYNVNLIKDLLLRRKLLVSNRCIDLVYQSETYVRLGNNYNSIPSDLDKLLIYCLRAILSFIGYSSDLLEVEKELPEDEKYFDRLLNAKSFDETIQSIRLDKWGILSDPDDYDDLFPSDDFPDINPRGGW